MKKEAYDYAHETAQLERDRSARQGAKKAPYSRGIGIGGFLGGALGAASGALGAQSGGRGPRAIVGGVAGSLVGGAIGALGTAAQHADIDDAKNVMSLSPEERTMILRSRARSHETAARENSEWMRHEDLKRSIKEGSLIGFLKEAILRPGAALARKAGRKAPFDGIRGGVGSIRRGAGEAENVPMRKMLARTFRESRNSLAANKAPV